MANTIEHINYALVEETRPPMYKAMKYWGKKPHNIWASFIKNYSKENDVIFDPFSGSAVSAFESVKLNRKAIAFDLNPMTSFMIESLSSKFNEEEFLSAFLKIEEKILKDKIYKAHYTCETLSGLATIYNYKWEDNEIASLACKTESEQFVLEPDNTLISLSKSQEEIKIPFWFPTESFPQNPSITHKFIQDIGGGTFNKLWTKRNLYILSFIFDLIKEVKNENIKLQLLSGFIQTLHLCSKMVVPRNPKSNREFSGSWGRADYMIRRKSMEQNPLIVFRRSCLEKQGVLPAMKDIQKQFPKGIKIHDVKKHKKLNFKADINYGTIDVADINDFIPEKSINFIITDPPYAGLVYYMDLSLIWLVWLKHINKKYISELGAEITVKKGTIERETYKKRMENAFKQIHKVLNDDSHLIVTFHHKRIQEWNDFIRSVKYAGFKFDKITHQFNKRTGESNVANPYGTSGADFYIRCVKHRDVDFSDDQSGLSHFIIERSKFIISERNQPTPISILISGLIPELLQAGFFQPDEYKSEIEKILNEHCGDEKLFFKIENNENKAGEYWWFNNPSEYINYQSLPLDERVEKLILSVLRSKISVKFDDILAKLFQTFPNGLTPDPSNIIKILERHAIKSSEKWKLKETSKGIATSHTLAIEDIIKIGKQIGYKIYVGKREQPELTSSGKKLNYYSDYLTIKNIINDTSSSIKRIEMIDALWIKEEDYPIECVFEVENSTGFIDAIKRGSNLSSSIQKFMVIPDYRQKELVNICDPFFIKGFNEQNWRYITYSELKRLASYSNISLQELIKTSRTIN